MERITIIGLGLIGTSIGLALKRANLPGVEIVGTDKEPKHRSVAKRRGAVDQAESNLLNSVKGARLVIIAVPVVAIREVMELIGPHLEEGCLVTETGSTKADVGRWAQEVLPEGVSYVGGHPMAGKEQSGPEAADADLFQGAVYAVCPSPFATKQAVASVVGLADTLGARPYFVDSEEHDSYVAAVSHLPFLLSTALMMCTSKGLGWREMSRMAASGFRDMTRLASGDPMMHRDICVTNGDSIVHWLDESIKELYAIRNMVKDDPEALERTLIEAWEARQRWLNGELRGDPPGAELPNTSDAIMGLLIGENLARRARELTGNDRNEKNKYPKR